MRILTVDGHDISMASWSEAASLMKECTMEKDTMSLMVRQDTEAFLRVAAAIELPLSKTSLQGTENHRAIKLDECSEERLLTTIIEKNSNEPLGMQIEVIGDAVNVLSVIEGSLAERAGIAPNYSLEIVNGTSLSGLTYEVFPVITVNIRILYETLRIIRM
eukprot:m.58701 g.58701  ORF g.58701 m.58701 type:complete len:161 (-) comp11193_c0_seq4:173-655(-)